MPVTCRRMLARSRPDRKLVAPEPLEAPEPPERSGSLSADDDDGRHAARTILYFTKYLTL